MVSIVWHKPWNKQIIYVLCCGTSSICEFGNKVSSGLTLAFLIGHGVSSVCDWRFEGTDVFVEYVKPRRQGLTLRFYFHYPQRVPQIYGNMFDFAWIPVMLYFKITEQWGWIAAFQHVYFLNRTMAATVKTMTTTVTICKRVSQISCGFYTSTLSRNSDKLSQNDLPVKTESPTHFQRYYQKRRKLLPCTRADPPVPLLYDVNISIKPSGRTQRPITVTTLIVSLNFLKCPLQQQLS